MKKIIIASLCAVMFILCGGVLGCLAESNESEASKLGLEEGIIYINNMSINYTSESESPNGDIDEDSLNTSKSIALQKCYVVIDFGLQMATNNSSGETITIQFTIDNASAVDCRINYADTSTNTVTTSGNVTTITATYSLPEKACSEKNVRLVISVNPQNAGTANINYEFSCETKIPYLTLQNNSSLEITQNTITLSNASAFEYSLSSDLSSYELVNMISSQEKDIVINSQFNGLPVTSIAANAFYGKTKIESITLPDSVTSIGDYAFYKCTALTSINIPKKLTILGNYAFNGCIGLTNITIPEKVTSIGEYAFADCTSLEYLTIGDSVTTIGAYAFNGCTSLEYLTIGNSVTTIGEYAFSGCTSLTDVTIPYKVTTIGKYVFDGCSSLSNVTFENAYGWYYVFITHQELDVTDESTNAKNFTSFWGNGHGYTWYRSDD